MDKHDSITFLLGSAQADRQLANDCLVALVVVSVMCYLAWAAWGIIADWLHRRRERKIMLHRLNVRREWREEEGR